MDTEREVRRIRSLTDKAQELYEEKVSDINTELMRTNTIIDGILVNIATSENEATLFEKYKKDLGENIIRYRNMYEQFCELLDSTHTADSQMELKLQVERYKAIDAKVCCALGNVEQKLIILNSEMGSKDPLSRVESRNNRADCTPSVRSRTPSVKSRSHSVRSKISHSSISSSVRFQRAEAARTHLKFAEKSASLMREKARLEEAEQISTASTARKKSDLNIELELLKAYEEVEITQVELDNLSDCENPIECITSPVPETKRKERTREYVEKHAKIIDVATDPRQAEDIPSLNLFARPYNPPTSQNEHDMPTNLTTVPQVMSYIPNPAPASADVPCSLSAGNLVNDFTNFLLKKDLLMSRLTNFNDDPATYAIWKGTFKGIVDGLNVNPQEETDLLIKWLGTESSKQALSLRAANAHDITKGLQRIWVRLDERYGAPELVENTLRNKINNFQNIHPRNHRRLYELSDILSEIESVKENPKYRTLLSFYDSSTGVNPIISKLPPYLQHKWIDRAAKYKRSNNVTFPPFTFFVEFVREITSSLNDPSFQFEPNFREHSDKWKSNTTHGKQNFVTARRTAVVVGEEDQAKISHTTKSIQGKRCFFHRNTRSHSLNECFPFKRQPLEERMSFLKENKICYKCCETDSHIARNCNESTKCRECESKRHPTALHECKDATRLKCVDLKADGGEPGQKADINSKCTTICGKGFKGRSCAKIVLVNVFSTIKQGNPVTVYAIIDDQSNQTLATTDLMDRLQVKGDDMPYTLSSCSGSFQTSGRRATGYAVQSCDGTFKLPLPMMIECDEIPQDTSEIPTQDVVLNFPHLEKLQNNFQTSNDNYPISLLIGRDLTEAHYVQEQIVGPKNTPFAQKLGLGWVVVGNVCLGKVHNPDSKELYISARKTHILQDGRGTMLAPCTNNLSVKDDSLFTKTRDDNKVAHSVEDRDFLQIMNEKFTKEDGKWTAPLPFRIPRQPMPNNKSLALKRASMLDANLKKNPTKREHFVAFMDKVLSSGAAEIAPPVSNSREVWYLPIFGVYHPKKPTKIRGVFDSSAVFQGISLNGALLSGPNLTNSLLGILLRFRMDKYAITGDIEQMFYSFLVSAEDRDYLRFMWYRDNNPKLDLIEYRMKAHVFGNSPSPAIATYGLRKTVENTEADVIQFVTENFYVDDALTSQPSVEQAISIMKRTQQVLKTNGSLRLHKIASNSSDIMDAFEKEDLGAEVKDLSFEQDILPTQRSLGMSWNLETDSFTFNIQLEGKPNTRRGMLSTLNSIFDPMGLIAPFVINGRILLRELTPGVAWDETLSSETLSRWENWKGSLKQLEGFKIPRMYTPSSLSITNNAEIHIFCDASEKAVAAAAYVRIPDDQEGQVGFVIGKTKLAPTHGHTIPRLELCAAVLATELGEIIGDNLNIVLSDVQYYSDSRVVLGYISNRTRRFYTYVANRVEKILNVSSANQWHYISTNQNPADLGSRGISTTEELKVWLNGPDKLRKVKQLTSSDHPLLNPELDKEVRPEIQVNVLKATVYEDMSNKFERFSNWRRLVKVIAVFKGAIRRFRNKKDKNVSKIELTRDSEHAIIKCTQRSFYSEEIANICSKKSVLNSSSISSLDPFLDENGILRVGGRLNQSCLPIKETNPVILPGKSHIARLLVQHFHEEIRHQGRLLTEGTIRNEGYWIVGSKRLISSIIHHCVTCRKLRGQVEHQKMANLPSDRLNPGPPFTSVGIDTFGPWSITSRRTRGGLAQSKRWATMFTCLTTRAVHIEVVEEMSSSSFINALRRFIALRGNVQEIRSDRGSNFIGSIESLKINAVNVEDGPVANFLNNTKITWIFNAPHSSHMGGVWERMIGIARKILNSMLSEVNSKNLTHEVFVTFMGEVCAIMNSRPVAPISMDPESPMILSPASLLNQKFDGDPISCLSFDDRDIYKAHWKKVQVLSNMFWKRWRQGYLQTRRKWKTERPNVKNGDVILLKDKDLPRNEWSVGLVTNAIKSESDGIVRKAEVRVCRNGKRTTYTRPISDMVILVD